MIGSCASWFINLLLPECLIPPMCRRRRTWEQEKPIITKSSNQLTLGLEETKLQEKTLTDDITKMKKEVNALAMAAKKTKNGRKPSAAKVDELRKQAEYIMQNLMIKEQERNSIRTILSTTQANLGTMRTYITQKTTFHNLNKTYAAIRGLGLNLEETERMIEQSAQTSDKIAQISTGMNDRLAASVPQNSFNDSISLTLDSMFGVSGENDRQEHTRRSQLDLPYPEVEEETEDEQIQVEVQS